MQIIPGLTSTQKHRIPHWVRELEASSVRAIALFPTVLDRSEREELYRDLASVRGLIIPHVHLRTDCDEQEMIRLAEDFATEAFNIHPNGTRHEFGPVPAAFSNRVFVENVDEAPADEELSRLGGICPDYAHLESARMMGRVDYVATVERQLERFPIGCCHVSAIRPGVPNGWNGGPDHHEFAVREDLSSLARYARWLPRRWVSLELENSFGEQLEAVSYLEELLSGASAATA
jgi:hypothetical protein